MKDIKTGKEKKAAEMTTRDLVRNLFPAGVRAEVRRECAVKPGKPLKKKLVIKADPK